MSESTLEDLIPHDWRISCIFGHEQELGPIYDVQLAHIKTGKLVLSDFDGEFSTIKDALCNAVAKTRRVRFG